MSEPKGQISTAGGGKTTGHQPEQFGKRTSQGRLQLAQHVNTAVSHRGREEEEEEVGGERAFGLREKGNRPKQLQRKSGKRKQHHK